MAELAQELIKARAQARSWTLQSYPGKIKLPSDILRPLPNAEAVAKVSAKADDAHGGRLLKHVTGGQNTVSVRGHDDVVEGD